MSFDIYSIILGFVIGIIICFLRETYVKAQYSNALIQNYTIAFENTMKLVIAELKDKFTKEEQLALVDAVAAKMLAFLNAELLSSKKKQSTKTK